MDEFFQNLREIQKKERSLSSLSPVGDDFYQDISFYFNKLMKKIDNNPFSFESYLLRDAQRIVAEICERREHKIANSVVMNVQRSYKIFKDSVGDGKPQIPSNLTPEEQQLYRGIYKLLSTYRQDMRSPLISYTDKKEHKSTSELHSSKMDSKTIQKDYDEFIDDDNNHNVNSSTDVKIPITQKTEVSPDVNEIPPEIQDEIYREFGKEPSRQVSKKSSTHLPETKSKDDKKPSNTTDNIRKKFEINKVQPSGNNLTNKSKDSGVKKTLTEVLMILDDLPPIMGIDHNVYGPFSPGDIITMPVPNARILIKNHKGKSIQRYK